MNSSTDHSQPDSRMHSQSDPKRIASETPTNPIMRPINEDLTNEPPIDPPTNSLVNLLDGPQIPPTRSKLIFLAMHS